MIKSTWLRTGLGLCGTLLLLVASVNAGPNFATSTNYAAGSGPVAVAVGDLNGDGKPDLVVANVGPNYISVLLGTGNGSFGAATHFTAGTTPYSVAIGDVNGDTKPDLVVANSGSDNVSVLLGTGTGSFGAPTNFLAGSGPTCVALADVNGDTKLDIVVADDGADINGNNVSVLLGTGTGSFAAATKFAAGANPQSVVVADLNGDTKPDLVLANINGNDVSVLLGTGTGSFGAATNFAAGLSPLSVAVGDLNGDTKPDLAVVNYGSHNVSVLLGTGTGSFGAATNFATGTNPYAVAVGDVNGDGKRDLVVPNYTSNNVSVLAGTGTGSFSAPTNLIAGTHPQSVAIADLNGDLMPDFVVSNFNSANVSVFLNMALAVGTWNERTVLRTLANVVDSTVDIGTLGFTMGATTLEITVNAADNGWSVAKHYVFPLRYNLSGISPANTWLAVLPTHDTGPYGPRDFALELNMLTPTTAKLRLRTVQKSGNAPTASIALKSTNLVSFASSSAVVAAVPVPTVTLGGNTVLEMNGAVGVGTAPAGTAMLDINGGNTRGLRLRVMTTAGAPATGTWNPGTMVFDSGVNLYICTVGGTPGTWKKVGN